MIFWLYEPIHDASVAIIDLRWSTDGNYLDVGVKNIRLGIAHPKLQELCTELLRARLVGLLPILAVIIIVHEDIFYHITGTDMLT